MRRAESFTLSSYIVGLGIEFAWAQWKGEEIQEGYLVSGILIPLIIPVTTPLWILVLAVAFAVIFTKEIFGGTGMNIFNVALAARAFLFFSYPSKMTGDSIWVAKDSILGFGYTLPDGFTMATPLGEIAQGTSVNASVCDMVLGLIPGSVGETSVIAIAIGAGAMAIIIRVLNPGYPEGMMLAILFGNMFAPLIDYCVVQSNISKRAKRAK